MLQTNFVYKINYLKDNDINEIHVFFGENLDKAIDLDNLFKQDPGNKVFVDKLSGNRIFNSEELSYIAEKRIPVKFLSQQINYDDSIGTIKLKIIQGFSDMFSLDEMYLFCMKKESFNSKNVYQTLTQNKKLPLTRVRFDQFLSNIIRNDDGKEVSLQIPDKMTYDYDDVLALNLEGKDFWVSKVLGQKLFILKDEYPFVYNPYDVTAYDEFIERITRKSLTTLNSHLLLNTGNIVENNIYLCLAEDVLENAKQKDLSEIVTIKIYFPFLFKQNIQNLELLKEKKYELLEKNKQLLTQNTAESFQAVNIFYDIYKERTSELNYQYRGIKFIKVILHSEVIVKMPLDIIFKLIHAREKNPLIKYNPSSRQENIYRLFTDKISKDGRKIPFLNKATIIKLMKSIGRGRSVSVYIEYTDGADKHNIICEFDEDGSISISCEFEKIMNISDITTIFRLAVNPIIEEVKSYFEENGYRVALFENLFDDNVDVKQITYQSIVEIDNVINIDDIIGCLTSIFIVESVNDQGKNIEMRYKRVSNFNKKTSQEAFVIEQTNQKNGLRGDDLLEALVKNYNISAEDARDLLSKMINELQVERGVKKNDIEIKINPGFKTKIIINPITSLALIEIENINDIQYLSLIPIYLDTFIRITQDQSSTLSRIREICGTSEREDIQFDDIIAASEVVFLDQEDPETVMAEFAEDELLENEFDSDKKSKNVLDLLFDEEEEEEDEMEGGADTSSSNYSLDEIVGLESDPGGLDLGGSESSSSNEITIASEEKLVEPVKNATVAVSSAKIKNIDGMKLANPTPFFRNMEERDPVLFLRENKGKFKAYSRTCPSADRRQPIILTDDELQKIEKEKPGFLKEGDVIKYGSTPDKQYNYICPRYWCLKTNMPIDPSEIVDGKHPTCGKIIPRDKKEVPKGAYIYEFFSPAAHGTRENYKEHKPGFVADGKHPDGLCIPCCFSSWNKKSQIARKQQCAAKKEMPKSKIEEKIEEKISDKKQKKVQDKKPQFVKEKEEYVKGPEKFPLDINRWGYLPMAIQILLRESNADCQVSKTNSNVKPFHNCLLRHGIQESQNQSFIACIADAKFFGETVVPTIAKMKDIIINSITIDTFITYQNGNLLLSFMVDDITTVDITSFTSSKIYGKIDPEKPEQLLYFKKIVASFQNFITFMRDPNSIIDYTYLWDIVTRPNPSLFAQGINLVILEIPEDDSTNNVELICPTNHYSNEYYEARKQSLIIMHKGDFFEPIYSYRNEETKLKVSKTFSEYDSQLSKTMKAVFKNIIKPLLFDTCHPLASMPNIYKFKTPISIKNLVDIIQKIGYEITNQVINYSSKVIGLYIKNIDTGISGFVPCYPSEINPAYEYTLFTDDSLFTGYFNTVRFLTNLYKESRGKIPCSPEIKVVEDHHIVGVLTETNQFIEVTDLLVAETVVDSLKTLNEGNHLVADRTTMATTKLDKERVEYIKKIKLETNFFQAFRNTVRLLLNSYENLRMREKIEEEINTPYILYSSKLNTIIDDLKTLIGDMVIFIEDYDISLIDKVTTCLVGDCSSKAPLCAVTDDNKCQLILPKNNLITDKNNEIYYFGRMADELIRYNRIKSYVFQPDMHLSFTNINYNLNENEIIVIQSLLKDDYFTGLEPVSVNEYAIYNTYDDAEPKKTQVYENTVTLGEEINIVSEEKRECVVKTNAKISSGIWSKCFPSSFNEIEYEKTKQCGFYFLIDVIKHFYPEKNLTTNEIRKELLEEYMKYLPSYQNQIVDVLILEGKKSLGDQVKAKVLSFQTFIYTESYFITNLDIWIILEKYKIPTVFISSKPILQSANGKNEVVAYGSQNDKFIFIVVPGLRAENVPKFKIIQSSEAELAFPVTIFRSEECMRNLEEAIRSYQSIESFLKNFSKKSSTAKPKKTKLVLITDVEEKEEKEKEKEKEEKEKKKEKGTTRRAKGSVVIKKQTRKKKQVLQIVEETKE